MTSTNGYRPYRAPRDKQGLVRIRELIEEALDSLGCDFAGDVRPGAERHLSQALDVIEVAA
jgi:hypothetical protein